MRTKPLVGILGLMLCFGCAGSKRPTVDPTLPEDVKSVEREAPRNLLSNATKIDEPSVRGRALALLIENDAQPAGGPFGAQALGDPDPWVQQQGVYALVGRVHEPETTEVLSAYIGRTDEWVNAYAQSSAAIRMIQNGHRKEVEPLQHQYKQFKSTPWSAVPHALYAMSLGDQEGKSYLMDGLAHADIAVETGFFVDIARGGQTELLPALEAGQEFAEDEMALSYALARFALGDVGGEHLLRDALGDEDESVQLEALDLLLRVQGSESLLQRAASQRKTLTRWIGEMALASRGQGPAEVLVKAITHEDRMVREYAARLAGTAPSSASKGWEKVVRQVIRFAIEDEDPIVRMEAIKAASVLNLHGLTSMIERKLVDEVRAVRVEAAGALLALERRAR